MLDFSYSTLLTGCLSDVPPSEEMGWNFFSLVLLNFDCLSPNFSISRSYSFSLPPALRVLYNTTQGGDWANNTNWMKGDPCVGEWHGVLCDLQQTVISL